MKRRMQYGQRGHQRMVDVYVAGKHDWCWELMVGCPYQGRASLRLRDGRPRRFRK